MSRLPFFIVFLLLLIAGANLIWGRALSFQETILFVFAPLGTMLIGSWLMYQAMFRVGAWVAYTGFFAMNSEVRIAVEDRGLDVSVRGTRTWFEWAAFNRINMGKRQFIFALSQPFMPPRVAIVVPKRAFASPQEAEAFVQFAQERFAASRAAA